MNTEAFHRKVLALCEDQPGMTTAHAQRIVFRRELWNNIATTIRHLGAEEPIKRRESIDAWIDGIMKAAESSWPNYEHVREAAKLVMIYQSLMGALTRYPLLPMSYPVVHMTIEHIVASFEGEPADVMLPALRALVAGRRDYIPETEHGALDRLAIALQGRQT